MEKNILSMADIKQLQLSMIKEIDDFCRRNNINYYLCYGSLIGAIRHGGYIPWDDDIDIVMKRKDYEIFFKRFNSFNSGNMKAISYEIDKDYYLPYGKVIDLNSILKEDVNCNYNLGVYIDIFPLDNVPDNKKKEESLYYKIKFYQNILTLKLVPISYDRVFYKNIILFIFQILLKPFSIKKINKKINFLAQTYKNLECSKLASFMCLIYGKREIWPSKYFLEKIEIKFENFLLSCPKEYDAILKQLYGDYMLLPPKEKQITHHKYNVYWKK